jgi:hypothetical protein
LEQIVKQLQAAAKEPPKTDRENKLVGTWSVTDCSRKQVGFFGLKLKFDGSCELAQRAGKQILKAK